MTEMYTVKYADSDGYVVYIFSFKLCCEILPRCYEIHKYRLFHFRELKNRFYNVY